MPEENKTPFINNDENPLLGKTIKPVLKPEKEIGIDTKDQFYQNIINAGYASALDMGAIEAFSNISNSREQVYQLLDTMSEDSSVASVLETYAEDATEYNDQGKIVWCESSNSDISAYVSYLLNTLRIDKNIYKWVYSLCKYGDVYLRLYRQSEYTDLLFDNPPKEDAPDYYYTDDTRKKLNEELEKEDLRNQSGTRNNNKKDNLFEDVKIKAYAKNDRYVRYLEMVPNPAEMFELTRFGKTAGYIKTEVMSVNNNSYETAQTANYFRYKFKRGDIRIYQPTEFVHACLEDNSSRQPEEVEIFLKDRADYNTNSEYDNDDITDSDISTTYSVKRGQSLLYSTYKIWRMLQLLENSLLLNRLTRSSLVRMIQVEVGDMPKESVQPHMMQIKSLIEQKSAFSVGSGMNEYTNPSSIENCVYIPTHGGVGAISLQNLGGDVNIKDIADLDYYQDKFYGSTGIPKQYFGVTKDGAGFDGGKSLSIISARYAKRVKRIQNTMIQAITDAINLILINDGLENYINKFKIKMLPPTTQDEIDRREASKGNLDYIDSIMNLLTDVQDPIIKMKMLKSLLGDVVSNTELISLLQQEIENLEAEAAKVDEENAEAESEDEDMGSEEDNDFDMEAPLDLGDTSKPTSPTPPTPPSGGESSPEPPAEKEFGGDTLPSGAQLGVDLTDFT